MLERVWDQLEGVTERLAEVEARERMRCRRDLDRWFERIEEGEEGEWGGFGDE